MFCKNCGTELTDGASFCQNCGTPVEAEKNESQQNPAPTSIPTQPELPMGWFKFIINFSLFAAAVLNVLNAITYLAGTQYEGEAEFVWGFFPDLKALDVFMGIAALVLAVYAIITRFQLAKFRKIGPPLLILMPFLTIVIQVIYAAGVISVLRGFIAPSEAIDFATLGSNIAGNLVLEIVNIIYFNKRKHLFVN